MQNILAFELILKLVAGLVLLVLPSTTGKVFGIAGDGNGLWPRLLGGVLIGLAFGVYFEIAKLDGVSIGACVVINFFGALAIFIALFSNQGSDTRRGRATLWFVALLLFGLGLVEIASV